MKIKESLKLNEMIRDRANSLANEPNPDRLIQKAKVLMAMIECQETMNQITATPEKPKPRIGDIHVNISDNGDTLGPAVPGRPRQPGDTGRALARALKKEFQR